MSVEALIEREVATAMTALLNAASAGHRPSAHALKILLVDKNLTVGEWTSAFDDHHSD